MLTVAIGVIAFVVLGVAISNENWGVVGFVVVVTLFLIIMSFQERQEGKADTNWTEYWAKGGPNRKRKQQNTKRQPAGRQAVRIDRMHVISEDDSECSVCGCRFRGKRSVCPACGARFVGYRKNYDEFDEEEDEMEAWDEEEGR